MKTNQLLLRFFALGVASIVASVVFSQSQVGKLPPTNFVDKHVFCQSGDNYTEMSCHIEMFDDVDMQRSMMKLLFDNAADNLQQCVKTFFNSYGNQTESLPYTHKNHTPVEAVTCTIEDYAGDFATFFIYKEHIPATIYMKETTRESKFVTYDLKRKCVLTKDKIFDLKKCKGTKAMQELRSHFSVDSQFVANFNTFDLARFDGDFGITDGHYLFLRFPANDNQPEYSAMADMSTLYSFLSKDLTAHHSFQNGSDVSDDISYTSAYKADAEEEKIYDVAETNPQFVGDFNQWMSLSLRYPDIDERLEVEGKCIVKFVVEPDGRTSNVNVLRHVSPTIDRESARVVSNMPQWTPATIGGEAVRCWVVLPIVFKLSGDNENYD